MIRKFATAAVAAVTLATASVGATTEAQAGRGGAFVAGLVGGAIIGGAIAQSHGYGYGYGPVYYAPRPVYYPTCHKVVSYDHYGNPYWTKVCH